MKKSIHQKNQYRDMNNPIFIATEAWNNTEFSVAFRASVAIVLLTTITACTSSPDVDIPEEIASIENLNVHSIESEPAYELSLTDSLIIDEQSGILFSGRISATVNELNEIFVTDFDQRKIFHFSENGDFIREYGGEGRGPGEFTGIQFTNARNGILAAYDYGPRRLNLFDTANGELIRDFTIMHDEGEGKGQWLLNDYHIMDDGNLITRMTRHIRPEGADPELDNRIMMISREGNFLDDQYFQLREPQSIHIGGSVTVRPLFMPNLTMRINDSGLFYGTTDRLLFHQSDHSGSNQGSIYYDLIGKPVTQSDIAESVEGFPPQFARLVEGADLPARWPVWNTFHVDDESRFWISLRSEDEENEFTAWWILDSAGVKLAEKEMPEHVTISKIRDNHVFASKLDDDGRRVIVRYTFEL